MVWGLLVMVMMAGAAALMQVAWSDSLPNDQAYIDDPFAVAVFSSYGQTYSLVGSAGGIQIVNITDVHSPKPIHFISEQTPRFEGISGAVDIEIIQRQDSVYAVAADFLNGTVWIINVTDPTSPTFVSNISGRDTNMGSPTDVELLYRSDDLYILVTASGSNTLHIISLEDLSSPKESSMLSASRLYALTDPRDVRTFEVDERMYGIVAAFGDDAVLILDVTNPDSPKWISRINHGEDGFTGLVGPESVQVWEVFGKVHAFVAGGGSNVIQVMDLGDPKKPKPIGCLAYAYGDSGVLDVVTNIDLLQYKAETYALAPPNMAIRIPAISDGGTGTIDCTWYGLAERDQMNHPAEMRLFETDGRTYILATGTDGVHVADVTNPFRMEFLASVRDGDGIYLEDPYGIAIHDAHDGIYGVAASFGDNAISILNLTDPSMPHAVGSLVSYGVSGDMLWPADVDIFGTFGSAYALVSDAREDVLQILDITDPASPTPLHVIREGSGFGDVDEPGDVETYWDGDRVYGLAAVADSVLVMDVTKPSVPVYVSTIHDVGGASVLTVGDVGGEPHLLIASGDVVYLFDMGDPATPILASSVGILPGISDLEIFEAYGVAYAALSYRAVDPLYLYGAVSDSVMAAVAGQAAGLEPFWRFGGMETISLHGRAPGLYAESASIQIISLADPASPHILESWDAGVAGLEDVTDMALFGIANRTYLAVTDHFDYEVKVLDVTRPDTPAGITSQAIDGKSGFDALTKPVQVGSVVIGDDTYGLVVGADGRIQMLDMTVPWRMIPAGSVNDNLTVPHAEGHWDLEVYSVLDKTYLLSARTAYVPYGNAVTIYDITAPDVPYVAGGWSGR